MQEKLMRIYMRARLFRQDSGQDLIEYALVAALIALGSVVAMKDLATGISNAFTNISGSLS